MALSPRSQRRVDRIHQEIPITQVLSTYGYLVHGEGAREEQFPCDLHGDGHDSKPSARIYPESNQFFCFACGKSRDAIQLIREKEGIPFTDALKLLETRFGLSPLPWEEEDRPTQEVFFKDQPAHTYEEEAHRAERLLINLTDEQELPMKTLLGLWEAFDLVLYQREKDGDERQLLVSMTKIRHRALKALQEQ